MKQKFNQLLLPIILFYFNNFVLIIFIWMFSLKGFLYIWFFTPFVFILFTIPSYTKNNTLESQKIMYLVKRDFLIRILLLIFNFFALGNVIKFHLIYLSIVNIILTIIGIYYQLKIYKWINRLSVSSEDQLSIKEGFSLINDYVDRQNNLRYKTLRQKNELKHSFNLILLVGYSYAIILFLVVGGIILFRMLGKSYNGYVFMLAFLLIVVYLYITEKKFILLGTDNHKFRDNFTLMIGVFIVYVLQGYVHIGTGTFNVLGVFFAILFFLPTFHTNQLIIDYFRKANVKNNSK